MVGYSQIPRQVAKSLQQPSTTAAILFYLQSICQQLRDASKGANASLEHLHYNQQQQTRSKDTSKLLALQI
eukprot:6415043-Amphidinium_carterae.1